MRLILLLFAILIVSCLKQENNSIEMQPPELQKVFESSTDPIMDVIKEHERLKNLFAFQMDTLDFNENAITPEITSDIDAAVYHKLAGIYVHEGIQIEILRKRKLTWGNDYVFGRESYLVDYDNDKKRWYLGGNGEAIFFTALSNTENSITMRQEGYTDGTIWEFGNGYLKFGNKKLLKASGPDLYKELLKENVQQRKGLFEKYVKLKYNTAKDELNDIPLKIISFFKDENISSINDFISEDYGLCICIDFSKKVKFKKEDINEENETFQATLRELNKDLNSPECFDISSAAVLYNIFAFTNIEEINVLYNNSITVEIATNEYEYLALIFVSKNEKWELVEFRCFPIYGH